MSDKTVIFLASQSPRRRYLIRKEGYSCKVISSAYIEKPDSRLSPRQLVLKHARGKLQSAKIPVQARFVVAADTVVALDGKVYGKPRSLGHACKMLGKLAGRTHEVYTGWAIHDTGSGKKLFRCVRSKVKIQKLSSQQIQSYFKKMNPLDKAGAYAVQSRPSIVEKINGSYSNVMGLPMEDFEKALSTLIRFKNEKK